jgi:Transposase zinc-binding domain
MTTKARPALELADIFRKHGSGWRSAHWGRISLGQLKAMSAIESCRTAVLGGHVDACENPACGHRHIAYNSCRNRHCPKCHVWTAPAVQEELDASAM